MTPKMRDCLAAIERLTVDGVSPTYRQLQAELGLSGTGQVHRLVHSLAQRGVIALGGGKARSIRVIGRDAEGLPFDRLAEAAVNHVWDAMRTRGPFTPATMRAVLVEAFTGGVA